MNEEMKPIKDNDVWDLIPLLEGVKPTNCKWILRLRGIQKAMYRDTIHVLSQRVLCRKKASTVKRLSL